MQDTAILALEETVNGQQTDTVCEKLGDGQYRINGSPITLPVHVNAASMLMNVYTVDSKVAQELIADSGFRVVEVWPGKALMQLLAVDYRENDLGDYNEAAISFPVTTPGESRPLPVIGAMWRMMRGKLANYIYRMPVNQDFTTHAGRFIWGFPKWVTDVDIQFGPSRADACFKDDGELVFKIAAKTGGTRRAPPQEAPSLAVRNRQAWKTVGITEGEGLTFSMGGEPAIIGERHPLARQLRSLGLPKKPLCCISIKDAKMVFEGPEPVALGERFSS